jgi:hypothetical protein
VLGPAVAFNSAQHDLCSVTRNQQIKKTLLTMVSCARKQSRLFYFETLCCVTEHANQCEKAHFEPPKLNFVGAAGAEGFWPNVNLAATAAAEGAAAPKLNLLGDTDVAVLGPGCESSCGFAAVASLAAPKEKFAAEIGGLEDDAAAAPVDPLGAAAAGAPQPFASGCFELPPGVLCGVTDAGLDGTLAATPGAVPPA